MQSKDSRCCEGMRGIIKGPTIGKSKRIEVFTTTKKECAICDGYVDQTFGLKSCWTLFQIPDNHTLSPKVVVRADYAVTILLLHSGR